MTDAAYTAKNWLLRSEDLEEKRKQTLRALQLLESKVNNCVSNYEMRGHGDLISAQAAREDLIIEYSTTCAKYEDIINAISREDIITLRVIERMKNAQHRALLIARYINRKSLAEIAKSKVLKMSQSHLYRQHDLALEELAAILETNPPQKLPNNSAHEQAENMINAAPA